MNYIFNFQLHIQDISPHAFRLVYLDCQNDGLSQDYAFELKCFSHDLFDVSSWGLKKAVIYYKNKPFRYGVLTSGKAYEKDFEGYFYVFTLSSPLAPLKTTGPDRVFVNKTVNEIVDKIFTSACWLPALWRWNIQHPLAVLAYRVQYHQSDFDFMMELLSEFKLHFIFEQDVLKISDNLQGKNSAHHVEIHQHYYVYEWPDFLGYDFEPATKPGLFTATIESLSPEAVHINHDGYYRIRFPFDQESANAEGSNPVPLLSPHFMHFPLKAGAEVAVRFLAGSIHQPILIGVIPEKPPEPGKYTHYSYAQHGINFIPEKITLSHGECFNQLEMARDTLVSCGKGNLSWRANHALYIYTQDNHQQNSQGNFLLSTRQHHTVITKAADMAFTSNSLMSFSAKNSLAFQANVFSLSSQQSDFISKASYLTSKQTINFNSNEIQLLAQEIIFQGNFSAGITQTGLQCLDGNMLINTAILQISAMQISGLIMRP